MVRVERLTKRYDRRIAVHEVSLEIAPGELVALLGPNGAGKSTLLKAIVGLVRPNAGQVWIGDRPLLGRKREALSLLGFVPQRLSFPPHLTISQALAYYALLKGVGQGKGTAAAARVGLSDSLDRRISELSGGTLQRLGLAQALLASPPLLVLDEPTVGLDPQVSDEFRALLARLNREGVTILLTSHLLGEVERLATRAMILKEGRLLAEGTLSHLLQAATPPRGLWVQPAGDLDGARRVLIDAGFVCEIQGAALEIPIPPEAAVQVLTVLRDAGLTLTAFWTHTPSLEEAFRRLVEGAPA